MNPVCGYLIYYNKTVIAVIIFSIFATYGKHTEFLHYSAY